MEAEFPSPHGTPVAVEDGPEGDGGEGVAANNDEVLREVVPTIPPLEMVGTEILNKTL